MSALLDTIIHNFGPLGIALGAGLEGETAVVIGGALARHGAFDPFLAALGAWLGSFVADQLFFLLGRWRQQGRFVAGMAAKLAFARALALIERHPVAFCLLFRFVYGFRIAGPVAIGVSRVPVRLFLALNALSAAVWAAAFTALGWRFGRAFDRLLQIALTPVHLAIMLVVVGAGVALAIVLRRRHHASGNTG